MKSIFDVNATEAPEYKRSSLRWVSWTLAFVLVGLIAAQLASFESFMAALANTTGMQGRAQPAFLAIFLTGVEILSLTVLVRLQLSPLMRWIGAFSVLLAPVIWLSIQFASFASDRIISDIGFVGGIIDFKLGATSLLLNLIWAVVAGLSVYNLGATTLFRAKNK